MYLLDIVTNGELISAESLFNISQTAELGIGCSFVKSNSKFCVTV